MTLIIPQGKDERFKKTSNRRLKRFKESVTKMGELRMVGEMERLEDFVMPDGKTPHYFLWDEELAYVDTKPFTLAQARKRFNTPPEGFEEK